MKYGLMDEGFYVIKNGVKYKAVRMLPENWGDKCINCTFKLGKQCVAGKEIEAVCDALMDYYWVDNTNYFPYNDNYMWKRSSYDQINFTINSNQFNNLNF